MNITDNIIDKILYKQLIASELGQFSKEYNVTDIFPYSGDVIVFNTLFKVGGTLWVDYNLNISAENTPTIKIFVNEELKYTFSDTIRNQIVSIPPFAKVKMTASVNQGELARVIAVWKANLIDKSDMYFTEVVE